MKTIFFLFVLIFSFLVFSCKQDKDDDVKPAPAKAELISSCYWLGVAETTEISTNPGVQVNTFDTNYSDCTKDDLQKFDTNGTAFYDEGPTNCNPSDPQIDTLGTWAFNSDQTAIIITYTDNSTLELTIIELSATTLKVSYTLLIGGVPATLRTTLIAQ